MMASLLQTGRNERGTASIELAFSLMIFLFVAFGIVEYGSIINERNALTQLARRRKLSLSKPDDQPEHDGPSWLHRQCPGF